MAAGHAGHAVVGGETVTGRLYGVGVGPGDPDLMTFRAHNVIAACAVVAFVHAEGRPSRARMTADPAVPIDVEEIAFALPMRPEPEAAAAVYDKAAERIADILERGTDVALLCEGDPLLYGSFIQFMDRLAGRCEVEIVPGLPSIVAAAAAARLPLVRRNEVLTLIPATLAEPELAARLAVADCAAILKTGRHLDKVRRALAETGMLEGAVAVLEASMPAEKNVPLAEWTDETLPYFALIIAHRSGPK